MFWSGERKWDVDEFHDNRDSYSGSEGTDDIWLNGQVCFMAYSSKYYQGNSRLDCNYKPRGEWVAIDWEAMNSDSSYSTDDSGGQPAVPEDDLYSYQSWDMTECPSGKYKKNHQCESIASNSCGMSDLGGYKVKFVSGCTVVAEAKEQISQFELDTHSGFYLAGKTCFVSFGLSNYRNNNNDPAQIYCNFQTEPIYVQSSKTVKSFRVWSF